MIHPSEVQLALLAGGDLSRWDRWRVSRHVGQCSRCANEVQAVRQASAQARDAAADLPKDLNWNRLAEEMTGNIRVGLAAGEAIARFDRPIAGIRPRLGWNAAMVLAGATVIFGAAFWTSLPREQAQHLTSSLQKIFTGQPGRHLTAAPQDDVVLEVSSSSIQVRENGREMTLMHPRSDGVTVSVNMRGSAGVRFVDADNGQVTTNKVYYAEQ